MKVRLLCWVEVELPEDNFYDPEAAARAQLDNFREAVLPSMEYGITIYRAEVEAGMVGAEVVE